MLEDAWNSKNLDEKSSISLKKRYKRNTAKIGITLSQQSSHLRVSLHDL